MPGEPLSRGVPVEKPLERSLSRTQRAARDWLGQLDAGVRVGLVPDVGPTAEVVLADRVLGLLEMGERRDLLARIRQTQDADSGAWLSTLGEPDLSVTTLAYWALVTGGDDRESEAMIAARRAVHRLGGAQRADFHVRLWLALSGMTPWSWLPAIPAELWLLPEQTALSPQRIAAWARNLLTAYHVLATTPARLHLPTPEELLLAGADGRTIPPRLTRPGFSGDLLQAFDRLIKLSRKLPHNLVRSSARGRATDLVRSNQQRGGGWFSVRPTLASLLALRAQGAKSDDESVRRGIAYIAKARGRDATGALVQGLTGTPTTVRAGLLQAAGEQTGLMALLEEEIDRRGPWAARADTYAGGWPLEAGQMDYLDVDATIAALEALRGLEDRDTPRTWGALRRAGNVLFAMQEPDGRFPRFERGEDSVPLASLPWAESDRLCFCSDAETSVNRTASALTQLAALGWRGEDDRVRKGMGYIERNLDLEGNRWSIETRASVARCVAAVFDPESELRARVEQSLRSRQRENGSFGTLVDTARALRGLLALDGPCVQAQRAARFLVDAVERRDASSLADLGSTTARGFGTSRTLVDESAGVRETRIALGEYQELIQNTGHPRRMSRH